MNMNNLSVFYHYVLDVAKQCDIGLVESLDRVRAMGYEGLAFDIVLLTDRAAQRDLYQAADLAVTSIYADVDFVHWEPERCRRAADDLLECCAFFGARTALVLPGVFTDGDDRSAGLGRIYEGLEAVCRLAKGSGIDVTIENFGLDDQLTALRRSADFCRRALGRPPLPLSKEDTTHV